VSFNFHEAGPGGSVFVNPENTDIQVNREEPDRAGVGGGEASFLFCQGGSHIRGATNLAPESDSERRSSRGHRTTYPKLYNLENQQ
jgi:hypothetical protein